jgi:predicted  nucleic acid-binding Zn-ribbon protein
MTTEAEQELQSHLEEAWHYIHQLKEEVMTSRATIADLTLKNEQLEMQVKGEQQRANEAMRSFRVPLD